MHFIAEWAKSHQVPFTCNEFGVYRIFTHPEQGARWLEDVSAPVSKEGSQLHTGTGRRRRGIAEIER
jgi:hypothetical protein